MYNLSSFLSKVALISVLFAVSVTYFEFLPISYQGMVFVSSVAVVLTIGSGILSLALATILLVKRASPKPANAAVISILSLMLAFGYVWSM